MRAAVFTVAATVLAACGGDPSSIPAAQRGAELVSDPKLSPSSFNALACSHCHGFEQGDQRLLAGGTLLGAAARPSLWGGYEPDLKSAVDFCLVYFMKGDRLNATDPDARALYEYLVSLADQGPPETRMAQPITIVTDTTVVPPRGDPGRGAEVHRQACQGCHGVAHTGEGRVMAAPILPDQATAEAIAGFPQFPPAAVYVEKVRHGRFFGVSGVMPPFSLERLSEADLGALIAFYGL